MDYDDLPERLQFAAQRVADDIVRRRLVPLWRVPFHLATRLQRVGGALAAYAGDPTVIREAVGAFATVLDDHPHSDYERDFSPSGVEALWLDVCDAWDRTRVPGSDALTAAFEEAQTAPVTLVGKAEAYGVLLLALVSIAYYLHPYCNGDPIYLPVERIGSLLRVHPTTAGSVIRLAARLGLLREIDPPRFKQGLARTFRFVESSPLYRPPRRSNPGERLPSERMSPRVPEEQEL